VSARRTTKQNLDPRCTYVPTRVKRTHVLRLEFSHIRGSRGIGHFEIIKLNQILNPISRMHCLWASIKSAQFSSPFSMMHSSRGFLVSGHAQQGFNFFFSTTPSLISSGLVASLGISLFFSVNSIFGKNCCC
jgi:hypothetical protein